MCSNPWVSIPLSVRPMISADRIIVTSSLVREEHMCGRFTLKTPAAQVAAFFGLDDVPRLEPRYNIAPSQPIAAVRQMDASRYFDLLNWGLAVHWRKNSPPPINARAETVAELPSFRSAFRFRRCLVPADGFYEWQAMGRHRQPYYITLDPPGLFAFAAIWEDSPEPGRRGSCALMTTAANPLMSRLHDRMPVILPPDFYATWLDPSVQDPALLGPLLRPYDSTAMRMHPVSTRVNKVVGAGPDLIEPVEALRQANLFE